MYCPVCWVRRQCNDDRVDSVALVKDYNQLDLSAQSRLSKIRLFSSEQNSGQPVVTVIHLGPGILANNAALDIADFVRIGIYKSNGRT